MRTCCCKHSLECCSSGFVQTLQAPVSKERTAWLVRDAGMTPGPEAAVAPGTTGAAVDPGHPSISINDDRIRWSFPGPGNPLPRV